MKKCGFNDNFPEIRPVSNTLATHLHINDILDFVVQGSFEYSDIALEKDDLANSKLFCEIMWLMRTCFFSADRFC